MITKSNRKIISINGGADPTVAARVTVLENNAYKVTYYAVISGASGTITPPTNATFNAGEFAGLNCILSEIDGSNKPTYISPKTAGGVIVTATLNTTTGAWAASGTYTSGSIALIYSIKITALNYSNLIYANILETVQDFNVLVNGGFPITLTATAQTNVTLPTSGTLVSGSISASSTAIAMGSGTANDITNTTNLTYTTGSSNAGGLKVINGASAISLDEFDNVNAGSGMWILGTGVTKTTSNFTIGRYNGVGKTIINSTTTGVNGGFAFRVANGADLVNLIDTRIQFSALLDVSMGLGIPFAPSARLHLLKTTEQLRIAYDASNYYSTTVGSAGVVTFNAVGASAGFSFSNAVTLSDVNLIFGTTTGTKIGTATTQKLSFWNKTPIVQPTTGITAATLVGGGGTTITATDTFGGYTLQQLAAIIINTGLAA